MSADFCRACLKQRAGGWRWMIWAIPGFICVPAPFARRPAGSRSRRIIGVRGDKLDPFSKGFICPKAYALTELHSDPDRLRRPLRRKGRDFEEISWDEAFDEAADRLKAIQARHGRNSVGY